ncbi:SBBP repeat-containing protein, partial [bacterium]|nr:SBBP repeat-containing protein [bacterium]
MKNMVSNQQNSLKKNLLSFLVCFCILSLAISMALANTYTIGTGTATNSSTTFPTPFGHSGGRHKHQFLYRASELTAAGMPIGFNISDISFFVENKNSMSDLDEFEVKIGLTSTSDLTDWETGLTTVYGPTTLSEASIINGSWKMLAFTTPFTWDGTSNIVIQICSYKFTWFTDFNASIRYSTTAFNSSRVISGWLETCASTGGSNGTNRSNIKFGGIPSGTPPAITHTPLGDTYSTDARAVTANITDSNNDLVISGLGGPRLYYRVNSGSWNSLSMSTSSPEATSKTNNELSSVATSSIPGQAAGSLIEYYLAAQDALNNLTTLPSGGNGVSPPGSTPPGTLYSYLVLSQPPSSILFSTFLGGNSNDYGYTITLDASGNIFVAGSTSSGSGDFPTTAGAYDTSQNGGSDAFISKLNSSGSSPSYSTFIGGSGSDGINSIAIGSSGIAYLCGYTWSGNFPFLNGFSSVLRGDSDAFVSKLNSSGNSLTYSTYLGGYDSEQASSISFDTSGNTFVTGRTNSTSGFPATTGAYDTSHNGGYDAFICKINPLGLQLVYSTFLGGSTLNASYSLKLDSNGNVFITGYTEATGFPTTSGVYDTSHNGGTFDAFVSKLNSTGTALSYSTFLGGSGSDIANSITLDTSGNTFITGSTASSNFPTTGGAYDTSSNGGGDAFVSKLNSTGTALGYSTFLGGSASDQANSITLDASGNVLVSGFTYSSSFPTTIDSYDTSLSGSIDAFISKLNSTASSLSYSSFLGGSNNDGIQWITLDGSGNCYVTGYTYSSDFPVTIGAYDTSWNGGTYDTFVSKFSFSSSIVPPTFTTGSPTLPGTGTSNGNGGTDFTNSGSNLGSIATQGGTTAMSLLNVESTENGTPFVAKYDLDCNGQTNLEVCFVVHSDWLTGFVGDPSTQLRIAHNNVFLDGNVITSLGSGSYRVCGTAPSCSPFFVQDQDDTPLAVTLSHFSLKSTKNSIQLNWTTESETNNLGFKVMRSVNNLANFNVVASYENNPNLKGQGNSATPTSYTWNDTEVE